MEKLIELLNEYEEEVEKSDGFKLYRWFTDSSGDLYCENNKEGTMLDYTESYTILISFSYGFIKRLVDNDKIDLLRLDNRIALSEFNKVERVLMALSIQDNPIELLVSILK